MPLTQVDDSQRIYEYACHEGNYALPGILRGMVADLEGSALGEVESAE